MVVFYRFILHFSHSFSNKISNLRPSMTYNMIKTQFFLHQTLDYSQIYNFTLEHDYKLKIIIVLKEVWVSKSKNVCVFLFFECFEHMDPFLWNILKFFFKYWNDLGYIHSKTNQGSCWHSFKLHSHYFGKSPLILINELFIHNFSLCLCAHEIGFYEFGVISLCY